MSASSNARVKRLPPHCLPTRACLGIDSISAGCSLPPPFLDTIAESDGFAAKKSRWGSCLSHPHTRFLVALERLRPNVNRYLKWAFIEANNSVCVYQASYPNRHVIRLYQRLRARKSYAKAIGAVARHLAEAITGKDPIENDCPEEPFALSEMKKCAAGIRLQLFKRHDASLIFC